MQIAMVLGPVVSTVKHRDLSGQKLLLVQPMTPQGKKRGAPLIAVDAVQAGIGDRVLVVSEGGSSRQVLRLKDAPIRSTIVGIVDEVTLG